MIAFPSSLTMVSEPSKLEPIFHDLAPKYK